MAIEADIKQVVWASGLSAGGLALGSIGLSIAAGPAAAIGATFGAVAVVAYKGLSYILPENCQNKTWKTSVIVLSAVVLALGAALGIAAAFSPLNGVFLASLGKAFAAATLLSALVALPVAYLGIQYPALSMFSGVVCCGDSYKEIWSKKLA